MKRREFIAIVGGAAAWPQQADPPHLIGLPATQARGAAFRQGLEALGWTEGRNIRIDYRFAGGDPVRVQAYAAELVNSAPDLIMAVGASAVAALKERTRTIPIVFAVANDPVAQGFDAHAHDGSRSRQWGLVVTFMF